MDENQDKNVEDTLVGYLKKDHQVIPATVDVLIDKCSTFDNLWEARRVTNGLNRLMLQNCPIKKDKDKDKAGKTISTYLYVPGYITPQWRKKQAKHQNTLPPAASPVPSKPALPAVPTTAPVDKDEIQRVVGFIVGFRDLTTEQLVDHYNSTGDLISPTEMEALMVAAAKKHPSLIKLHLNLRAELINKEKAA